MLDEMIKLAVNAKKNAYAPYSNFYVGCCIRTTDNRLYAGCNVENSSYGLALCAETSAIANMITQGEKTIAEAVVISSGNEICRPCGACRQRLLEFSSAETLLHMLNQHQEKDSKLLSELLPYPFTLRHKRKIP